MTGAFMRKFVAGLPLLASAFLTPAAHAAGNCQLKQLASLPLTVADGGEILVPIRVASDEVLLFLHTGSARSGLYRDHVRSHRPEPVTALNGRLPVTENVRLNSVALGQQRLGTVRFNVINADSPPMKIGGETAEVEGVLGGDLLASYDYELDLAGRRLNLYSQDHCPAQGVYWSASYQSLPLFKGTVDPLETFVVVEINERHIEATLSTGTARTWLSTDVSRRLYGLDRDSPALVAAVNADAPNVRLHPVTLSMQNVRWTDYPVLLANAERPSYCQLRSSVPDTVGYNNCTETPLQVGRDLLVKLRLFVANRERKVYFTANDGSIR